MGDAGGSIAAQSPAPASTSTALIVSVAAIVAAMIAVVSGQQLFNLAALGPTFDALGAPLTEAAFTVVVFGALLAVAAVGITLACQWPGIWGRKPLPLAAAGLAIGAGGFAVSLVYAVIAGQARAGEGVATALAIGTLLVAFQAAVEEVYFRGWLQPILVRAWGATGGVLAVAVIFAGLHIAGGARSPVSLVNLFLGGLLFGVLALRSGGIALPIAAHFAWNWSEIILFGLLPNPGVGSFGAIVDLDIAGAAWWGGSAEGLNASVGVTLALAALLVPAWYWRGATVQGPSG